MGPHRCALATVALLVSGVGAAAEASRPVVAVFGLESKGAKLKTADLDRLSDYIGASLAESGRYLVVPREELKAALERQKANSYKQCYAQSCQIEVGKELAAEKSLAGSVSRFGKSCLVSLTLFDLAKATQETAGTARGGCSEDAVLESVDAALRKLTRAGPVAPATRVGRTPKPPPVVVAPSVQGADYGDLEAEVQAAAAKAAREAAERTARQQAARRDWEKIERYVRSDDLATGRRVEILQKFLTTFPSDNPHEADARQVLASLQARSDMVRVPAGKFLYGCHRADDKECESDEKTAEWVTLGAFSIDRYETTVQQYRACVKAGRCTKPKSEGACNWGSSGRDDHPINCITWKQADTYCRWAGKRLPTEKEWEKAARGSGDGRKYPWGNHAVSCARAVVVESGNGCGKSRTWAVGSKPSGASPYGAQDMLGNVWEWTSDWYTPNKKRSTRGGSWHDQKKYARVSNRLGAKPTAQFVAYGVRCAQ